MSWRLGGFIKHIFEALKQRQKMKQTTAKLGDMAHQVRGARKWAGKSHKVRGAPDAIRASTAAAAAAAATRPAELSNGRPIGVQIGSKQGEQREQTCSQCEMEARPTVSGGRDPSKRRWRPLLALVICLCAADLMKCDDENSANQLRRHLASAAGGPPASLFDDDELEAEPPLRPGGGGAASRRPAPLARAHSNEHSAPVKLHIMRLLAPESVQNGTQNVTLDCMFKYDPKLDQKLTIKWFFEDELEPIYQWIPELNKRVFSDKWEHLLDKSYQVTEDLDWMLHAYKTLIQETAGGSNGGLGGAFAQPEAAELATDGELAAGLLNAAGQRGQRPLGSGGDLELASSAGRKLLALKLSRLAKLGSEQTRQLLRALRQLLGMEHEQVAKFRALRLLKPTLELSGRFTCSISSLESDDLQSARLLVYEPPASLALNVSRAPGANQFNLSCRAGPAFPRPSLALYRYRANQLEPAGAPAQQQLAAAAAASHAHRPRLAATQLRQELLAGTQTQLTISARNWPQSAARGRSIGPQQQDNGGFSLSMAASERSETDGMALDSAIVLDELDNSDLSGGLDNSNKPTSRRPLAYEIATWALVDEASLSANLVTQFECVLTIEGTNYEQRQSLALQKGWHVSSQALMARSTLVGLMSVLASALCLIVALASALLVFKLMRRHANKSSRVHQTHRPPPPAAQSAAQSLGRRAAASGHSNQSCEPDTTTASSSANSTTSANSTPSGASPSSPRADGLKQAGALEAGAFRASFQPAGRRCPPAGQAQVQHEQQSDGIYRVPDSLKQAYQQQQQQQQSTFVGGARFGGQGQADLLAPSGGWSPASFASQVGQQQHSPNGLAGGGGGGGPTSLYAASNSAFARGLPAYALEEPLTRPAGAGVARTASAGSTGHAQPAGRRGPGQPATISVNGKQLYC